jgi:hypothetical protein
MPFHKVLISILAAGFFASDGNVANATELQSQKRVGISSPIAERAMAGAVSVALGKGDYITAYQIAVPRALLGEAWAQATVGAVFSKNRGFLDSCQEVVWFDKAARQGNYLAMERLAEAYSAGQGVVRDHAKAYRWILAMIKFRLAAETEDPEPTKKRNNYGHVLKFGDERAAWYRDAYAKPLTNDQRTTIEGGAKLRHPADEKPAEVMLFPGYLLKSGKLGA